MVFNIIFIVIMIIIALYVLYLERKLEQTYRIYEKEVELIYKITEFCEKQITTDNTINNLTKSMSHLENFVIDDRKKVSENLRSIKRFVEENKVVKNKEVK